MSTPYDLEPGFDPRIADWLETDPDDAPTRVLETVLAAAPSIPQRRASRMPRRYPVMNRFALTAAVVTTLILVLLASTMVIGPAGRGPATPSPTPLTPSPTAAGLIQPTGSAPVDWSFLPGRLLVEHLGNALDLSESSAADYNPDTRRFYFMDPKDMTSNTVTEFLKGQPATGKTAADISSDQRKIVFQDWADQPRLYEANLDGTGFHRIPIDCTCQLLYPDYDPTATKIVYVRIQGEKSWLEIRDLATGATTKLVQTVGAADDDVPEQPAWSPDGASIAFSSLHWGGVNDPVVGTVRYGDQPPSSGKLSIVDVASGRVTAVPLTTRPVQLPGDVQWTPDGRSLVYTSGPASTTGSDAGMRPSGGTVRVNPDGTGVAELPGGGGPSFLPDGQHLLLMNDVFYVANADGTQLRPVKTGAMDVSEQAQGFAYIGHWIGTP